MRKLLSYPFLSSLLFCFAYAIEPSEPGTCFSVDYLFWEFTQEQLAFTETGANQSPVNTLDAKEPNFGFSSGFRGEIGYNFSDENFDLGLAWTSFYVNKKNDYFGLDAEGNGNLISIYLGGLSNGGDVPTTQSAASDWRLHFNILDLSLGYTYSIGKYLTLRPLMGLKGGWVYQSQYVIYGNALVAPSDLETATATLTNDFKGIGPKTGVDLRWRLARRYTLFSTLSAALLYGHFDTTNDLVVPSMTGTAILNLVNSRNGMVPFIQMLLGMDWNGLLFRRWPICIGAAYEVQYWWNMVRVDSSLITAFYVNYRGGGDLFSQGLTLQTSFAF